MRIATLALLPAALLAQTEYRGTLEPDLFVPGGLNERVEFKPASDGAFVGKIREAQALFVEPATLWVDVNGDGRFSPEEKYDLTAGVAEIRFPLHGPIYTSYPVKVYRGPQKPGECILGESPHAFVRGAVLIGGRTATAGFAFDWKKNAVTPNHGWQGFDGEYSFVDDDRPVYHVGDAYAWVRSVIPDRREFVLAAASAADYNRIDLKIGEKFPDFTFTDLDGKTHRLSDYAGALLDFWATWCAPCIADLPRLRERNAHGVQIIGINVDQNQDEVRAMHLPWPQTELSTIRDLVERRARIQAYPTYVLLDRDHRIVAVGEAALNCDRCDPSSLSRPGH
jgi:thiol-disulfide isomerase/thioredoxin